RSSVAVEDAPAARAAAAVEDDRERCSHVSPRMSRELEELACQFVEHPTSFVVISANVAGELSRVCDEFVPKVQRLDGARPRRPRPVAAVDMPRMDRQLPAEETERVRPAGAATRGA